MSNKLTPYEALTLRVMLNNARTIQAQAQALTMASKNSQNEVNTFILAMMADRDLDPKEFQVAMDFKSFVPIAKPDTVAPAVREIVAKAHKATTAFADTNPTEAEKSIAAVEETIQTVAEAE